MISLQVRQSSLPTIEDIYNGEHFGLEVKKVPRVRGFGVFAHSSFSENTAIVRYHGERVTIKEARRREKTQNPVSMVYYVVSFFVNLISAEREAWNNIFHFQVCCRPRHWRTHQPQDKP